MCALPSKLYRYGLPPLNRRALPAGFGPHPGPGSPSGRSSHMEHDILIGGLMALASIAVSWQSSSGSRAACGTRREPAGRLGRPSGERRRPCVQRRDGEARDRAELRRGLARLATPASQATERKTNASSGESSHWSRAAARPPRCRASTPREVADGERGFLRDGPRGQSAARARSSLLLPRRRVVCPAAAKHRRDDAHRG